VKIIVLIPSLSNPFGLGYFYERAFRKLGHEVRILDAGAPDSLLWRLRAKFRTLLGWFAFPTTFPEASLNVARHWRPDLTVVVRCETLSPVAVAELSKASALGCCNIYPDSPFVIPGRGAPLLWEALREYRCVMTFSQGLVPVFKQLGARRVEWLPFAYDPGTHFPPAAEVAWDIPICYAGTWGPLQERWLEPLAPLGLRIFGNSWERLASGSPLVQSWVREEGRYEKMTGVLARSQVAFNVVRAEHGCAHSMKTFEIPACGGVMLTNRTPEQEMFFEDGRDCVFFDTPEEAFERASSLLGDPSRCRAIRAAALKAVAPHTYEERARSLIEMMERV
jgi:hypothetical protein